MLQHPHLDFTNLINMSNVGFSGFNLAQFFMPFYHEKNDSFSSLFTFYEVENLSFISFTELVKQ